MATFATAAQADSPSPDLVVAASPVARHALVGDRLTYSLSVVNHGGGAATQVLLKAALAGPVSVDSAQTDRGSCAVEGDSVTCALGTLQPAATATAAIAVGASGPGSLAAHFTVVAAEPDAEPASNTLIVDTGIALPAAPVQLPAAGPLLWSSVSARTAPRADARVIKVLPQFRPDLRPEIVLALESRTDAHGVLWYRIEVPMRPNGRTGWIRADAAELQSVDRRIVIHRGSRTLELWRGNRRLLTTKVAVGAPGMETPLGNFYVTAKFKPPSSEPILGVFAMETSAYSRLTEWPGGGIVGIHGTDTPSLLGRAVSHGCVRVANAAILRLASLAPLGTPVLIRN